MDTLPKDNSLYKGVPESMRTVKRCIAWKPKTVNGKTKKVPVYPFTSTDAATWKMYDDICAQYGPRVAFVAAEGDRMTMIDVDNCLNADGTVRDECKVLVADLLALRTYVEISVSGLGLHAFIRGTVVRSRNVRTTFGGIEMYDRGRYFCLTGKQYGDVDDVRNDADTQADIDAFSQKWLPNNGDTTTCVTRSADAPARTDFEVFEILCRLPNREKFAALHGGVWSGYYKNESSADYGYCRMVRFVTQNPAQIDSLYRQSGLCRDKWFRPMHRNASVTYGEQTIARAIAKGGPTYTPEALRDNETWLKAPRSIRWSPWWTVRCNGERSAVRAVLEYLAARADVNGESFVSGAIIAHDLQMDVKRVWPVIRRLVELGILTKKNRYKSSNAYSLRYDLKPGEDVTVTVERRKFVALTAAQKARRVSPDDAMGEREHDRNYAIQRDANPRPADRVVRS